MYLSEHHAVRIIMQHHGLVSQVIVPWNESLWALVRPCFFRLAGNIATICQVNEIKALSHFQLSSTRCTDHTWLLCDNVASWPPPAMCDRYYEGMIPTNNEVIMQGWFIIYATVSFTCVGDSSNSCGKDMCLFWMKRFICLSHMINNYIFILIKTVNWIKIKPAN